MSNIGIWMSIFLFKGVMIMSMNQGFSFFQGLSSSSGSGNMNYLSDYASIKSGSYGRLMKAYYGRGQNSSTTASGSSSSTSNVLERILEERRNPKVSEEVKEANANLVTGISTLKSSVSTLQNSNTFTDTENGQSATAKVSSAMKNFVSQYNDVVNASKQSTLTNKTAYVANMMKATAANADKLSEIGVTINDNGTLQFNESKLQSVELSKVQELFSPDDNMSYGSTVLSRLQFAGIAGGVSEDKNNTAGTSAASLKADGEALASDKLYQKIKDKDGNESYDIDKIFSTAKSFVTNYNNMFDAAKSSTNSGVISNLAQIREKTAQNKDMLEQFGISVDEKGKLKIDEDKFKKSDMSEVQKFFKDYGSSIATNASLVDYYTTTKANATNGYTAAGAYNVQGSSRFADFI
jgi:Flagellar hook-associated protein 2 C-terminus.